MNDFAQPKTGSNFLVMLLFMVTLFTSALLLFVVQPLFGKLLLPLLGGSPAVWNTCMVFYQTLLFLGYAYAHLVANKLTPQHQAWLHGGLVVASFIALPIGLPSNAMPPTDGNPVFWLFGTLLLAIGLPFFVVSTTAPLMQKWFAGIGHHTSDDPYYLSVASNTGSLLALLSYPFLIEPNIGLVSQRTLWAIGYGVLAVLLVGCAATVWRNQQPQAANKPVEPLSITTQLHWLLLALVPSSLLLGLTNFISTDIASVPLLWIIPLTVYLLSFVLVFSKYNDRIHPMMVKLQPMVLLPFIAYSFINPAVLPYWLDLGLHVLAFFLAIMVCHGELVKNRPDTAHLTTFYLIMSFAGMLGGLFNTFVAPFIFNAVYEYPLMIVAALLLRPGVKAAFTDYKQALWQAAFPLALLVLGIIVYASVDDWPHYFDSLGVALILLVGLSYAFRNQPITLALLTGGLIAFTMTLHGMMSHTLYQVRTFFGVLAVRESVLTDEQGQPEKYHELFHGTTKHGAQRLAANVSRTPLTYYSVPGPMGQLFKAYDGSSANWNVGVVGLGAGALTCYAKPGQQWVQYEIDPMVVSIASNTQYFSYVSQCGQHNNTMKVGDARLSLQQEPDAKFDLLVLDAFSSDAVPTHLLTQEALSLYFKKLKPTGLLAFHITNRHLAIKKVLADHAQTLHFDGLLQEFKPQLEQPLVVATDWVVMSKDSVSLEPLRTSNLGNWQKLPLSFGLKPWTDDFTNIVGIWR
jgi:hypothetical protein